MQYLTSIQFTDDSQLRIETCMNASSDIIQISMDQFYAFRWFRVVS